MKPSKLKVTFLEKTVLVEKVAPAIIFLALWLNGSVYPLLLLPFLYVVFVEKRGIRFLGFQKNGASKSLYLGTMVSALLMITHYFVFRHYFPLIGRLTPNLYDIFTDVLWYPLYEEIAYRSFFLNHFADLNLPSVHRKNLVVNLAQSTFFVLIHKHHVASGVPLVLVAVFLLAFLNGFVFNKTKNISGCLLSHCAVNAFGLTLRYV